MNSNVLRAIFPILALAIQVNVSAFAVILAKMMDYKVSEDDTDARGATSDAETAGIDDAAEICNPLATTPSKVIEDTEGRRRFLGPSSTWAYIQQAMSILQQCIKDQSSPQLPTTSDGGAFVLDWPSTSQTTPTAPLTIDRLPSLTYSLYLTDTVKFYLGPMYHLYDEDIFRQRLNDFYATGPWVEPPRSSRLWFIQYLLIMALGKALIMPGSSDKRPTGCDYVLGAIELLPDVHGYYTDSILSVEILCCLSLYLQSIDHRNAAYNYIGQALRIALSQGFHRELIGASLTAKELNRHRRAWWTLYILDKRFSSLMGAPNCIQDNEITVLLPEPDHDQGDYQMFGLHVRLTRLLADVLRTSLDVLVALQRQNLLEAFLPFDLDCTISAAISLALIQAIPATSHNCSLSINAALDVLDSMVMRGYVIAQYRKAELESLLETLHTIFKHQSSTEELNHSYQDGRLRSGNASILPDMEAQQQPPNVRINRSSPDFILSLAELLDWESIMEFQGGDLEAAWL
ncbi:transcriptional regulator family: Fungal Specific TF [Trichoderma harzianum]|nr:transcriptional regulator family: Fungal Specific TF [Trichoderma harzianum]